MADYTFLPWARRGLAATLPPRSQEPYEALKRRAELNVTASVTVGSGEKTAKVPNLHLYGPGDITGFDTRVIVRVEPPPGTANFRPNDLPLVEFSEPEFPWAFTPAGPSSQNRLQPWLCLVCVRKQPGVALVPRRDGLPVLELKTGGDASGLVIDGPGGELPNPREAWAWAHVQVAQNLSVSSENALAKVQSERVVARLLCPRNLLPHERYLACLVPLFEEGRLAGLGEDLPKASPDASGDGAANQDAGPLRYAWKHEADEEKRTKRLRLPVYHHWEFGTGLEGDFESLVRRLKPGPLPPEVGTRPVDVRHPGFRTPGKLMFVRPPRSEVAPAASDESGGGSFSLENLLREAGGGEGLGHIDVRDLLRRIDWGGLHGVRDAEAGALLEAVREGRLDSLTMRDLAPILPLPVRWEYDVDTVQIEAALRHPDFRRERTEGTERLRRRVEEVLRAGEGTDAEPVVGPPVYGKWHAGVDVLPPKPPGDGRTEYWLRTLNTDVRHRMAAGIGVGIVRDLQEHLMASAWDQVGEIRRVNQMLQQAQLARQASGVFYRKHLLIPTQVCDKPAPPPDFVLWLTAPVHRRLSMAPKRSSDGSGYVNLDPPRIDLPGIDLPGSGGEFVLNLLTSALTVSHHLAESRVPAGALTTAFRRLTRPRGGIPRRFLERNATPTDVLARLADGRLTVDPFEKAPPEPDGLATWEHAEISNQVLDDLTGGLRQTWPKPAPSPDWGAVNAALCDGLDPERTVCHRAYARLPQAVRELLPAEPVSEGGCSLEPILAAPRFPQPMYAELKARSQEYLLAGLDKVPPNTITLVETNPTFVESFIVGLNHEMGAELLWREFPTDRRGTYFRRFWDTRGSGVASADDIGPMHHWKGRLGQHLKKGAGGGQLVLLIRGELLRLFPNTHIYAIRAVWDGDSRRPAGTSDRGFDEGESAFVRYPVFRGALEPDVTFLGFDLRDAEARGDDERDQGKPGWFFMLEGQPTEPRFGLDETVEFKNEPSREKVIGRTKQELMDDLSNQQQPWSDIAWGDLIRDAGSAEANEQRLDALSYIPVAPADGPTLNSLFGAEMGGIRWGHNAAHMAYITLQLPVRLAIHASKMLEGP